jgi:hypothetical protein
MKFFNAWSKKKPGSGPDTDLGPDRMRIWIRIPWIGLDSTLQISWIRIRKTALPGDSPVQMEDVGDNVCPWRFWRQQVLYGPKKRQHRHSDWTILNIFHWKEEK